MENSKRQIGIDIHTDNFIRGGVKDDTNDILSKIPSLCYVQCIGVSACSCGLVFILDKTNDKPLVKGYFAFHVQKNDNNASEIQRLSDAFVQWVKDYEDLCKKYTVVFVNSRAFGYRMHHKVMEKGRIMIAKLKGNSYDQEVIREDKEYAEVNQNYKYKDANTVKLFFSEEGKIEAG